MQATQLTPGGKVFGYLPPFDPDAVDGVLHFYYEYARADRAHELRHAAVALT